MDHGIHHLHKRKRAHQKLAPFPHPERWKRNFDRFLFVIAIIGPLNSLPQILKIYLEKNAAGISPLSFGLYMLFNIPWIIYGSVHKEPPIIIAYCLWFFSNLLVVIGTMIY
jgi:MtN3 and saliva related transmembrane protein